MWALWTSAHRARTEWRLLLVIVFVALIASTLITSLGVLVAATEQSGLRTELAQADDTEVGVTIIKPSVPIAQVDAAAETAVQTALGESIAVELVNSVARSAVYPLPELSGEKAALAYLGEDSKIRDHALLVSGDWPTLPGTIALPDAAIAGFGLALGDTVSVTIGDDLVTVQIVATYTADDPQSAYWRDDPVRGLGFDPNFPLPDTRVFVPTNAMGPLLFAPGGMDAADVTVARLDVTFQPDFSQVDVAELSGLVYRLGTADDDVPADMGDVASLVVYFSTLDETMDTAASGLVVTRSTVVVASLLLLVLAVAALAQTARLLFEGRTAERRLLQSRGASRRQVLLLSLIEAAAIGLITLVGSPLLALLVYRILAAQPPMVAAGMPADAPLQPATILIAAGIALVFVLILLAPLLRKSRAEVARGARQRRFSGLMSSGLDIGLVALAAVAYWQLSSYKSPVEQSASLAVDPLLVAGPAIALLAGALLCMRFIPLFARLLERFATRSTGTIVPLAAWEVARRAQRAIAAVLLLTLAIAVAAFSLSFLATWKQSQIDQADVAVGAPLQVPAVEGETVAQATELGDPQPTTRRQVTVAGPSAYSDGVSLPGGTAAAVVALTREGREFIADGRAGTSGGAALQKPLAAPLRESTGIPVAVEGLAAITATVQLGNTDAPVADTVAEVRVVLESGTGLLSTLSFGTIAIDGNPWPVSTEVGEPMSQDLRIVGFQVESISPEGASTDLDELERSSAGPTSLVVSDLAALSTDDLVATPLSVPQDGWFVSAPGQQTLYPELVVPPTGDGQLEVDLSLPQSLAGAPLKLVVTGWNPRSSIPAVITDDLARTMNVSSGVSATLVISSTAVPVSIDATTPLIPGSGLGTVLSNRNQPELGAIAVDQGALFRALVAAGVSTMPLDEWWVDVPSGTAIEYLDAHADVPGIASAVSAELVALDLQQGPLRVPTQAALWLAIIAAAILAAVGFAVHTAATLRLRNTELAQLRAIGFTRRSLVALIGAESAFLAALGTLFGIALGVLLGHLVGPLIAVAPTGRPTVPSVIVEIPWVSLVLLVLELVAVLSLVVVVVARAQKGFDPAKILRAGD
jgi:ABC-type antimicrobial peptide transport system permease subunit